MTRGAVAMLVLAQALALATQAPPAMAANPQQDYILYCMGCHGPDGEGVPGRVPPVARTLVRLMRTADGRDYLLRVPGASNAAINDAQLAGVLNWIAWNLGGGESDGSIPPFTTDEVAAHRRVPLADVKVRRTAVIAALQAAGLPAPASDY